MICDATRRSLRPAEGGALAAATLTAEEDDGTASVGASEGTSHVAADEGALKVGGYHWGEDEDKCWWLGPDKEPLTWAKPSCPPLLPSPTRVELSTLCPAQSAQPIPFHHLPQ